VDTVGGESYTLRVRNLATGEDVLARPIKKVREIFCLGVAQEKQPSARNHEEVF
jgi:protease II